MDLFQWSSRLGRRAFGDFRKRATRKRRITKLHPRLDGLEERALLSTFTVTNINDTGTGSLRAAIGASESGDTIKFASSLFSSGVAEIVLTSGELDISDSLTITGPTNASLIITGDGVGRAFDITTPGQTVQLSNLLITGGVATEGGGILDNGSALTLKTDVLESNEALATTPGANAEGGRSPSPAAGRRSPSTARATFWATSRSVLRAHPMEASPAAALAGGFSSTRAPRPPSPAIPRSTLTRRRAVKAATADLISTTGMAAKATAAASTPRAAPA
jgi:hypothetical protein